MDDFEVIQILNDLKLEVRNFKKNRNRNQWHWSCEVCGDSRIDTRKARFGVTKKDNVWVCNCFNCGYSNTFNSYLKHFHPRYYDRVTVSSFNNNIPQMYDLNYLVEGAVEDKKLIHLFFINRYSNTKLWLEYFKSKKISLKESNIRRLYNIHKDYWNARSMVKR